MKSSYDSSAGNTRWHIDASTLAILEQVFSLDQFPNAETRKKLGADLNVSTRQIQVWFQNRRQRERKLKSASGLTSAAPSSSALPTPVTSSEDISSALMEFGGSAAEEERKDSKGVCTGLPLAPMPRLNSGDSVMAPEPGGLSTTPTVAPSPVRGQTSASSSAVSPGGGSERPATQGGALARPSKLLEEVQAGARNLGWPAAAPLLPLLPRLAPLGSESSLLRPPLPAAFPLLTDVVPSVAARLAAACQSTLIGRTLQMYGGIIQAITEAQPPYKILSVSPGWQRLCGWTRDEVVGRPLKFMQGAKTEAAAVEMLMRGVRSQQPVSVRLTNYTKAGESFVHQLSCEPLRDPSGATQCFQATSLVLRPPGEAEAAEELAVGQMPSISTEQVPPLWPLLGRRPELPRHGALAPPQAPPEDEFDLLGWLDGDKGEIDDEFERALFDRTTGVC